MSFLPPDLTFEYLNGPIRAALIAEAIAVAKAPVGSAVTNAIYQNISLGVSHLTLHFSTKDPSPTNHGYFDPMDMSVEGVRQLGAELLVLFPDRVYQSLGGGNFIKVNDATQITCRTLGLVLGATEIPKPFYPHLIW